jgi:hypothetical protein
LGFRVRRKDQGFNKEMNDDEVRNDIGDEEIVGTIK